MHDGGQHAGVVQLTHAVAHCALPRQHHPLCGHHLLGRSGPNRFHPFTLRRMHDGLRDRTQITHPIINNRHGFHR